MRQYNNQIKQELTNLLFAGAIKPNLFVICASLIILLSLKATIPIYPLAAWTASMFSLAGCRFFICYLFNKKGPSTHKAKRLHQIYIFLTASIGIAWGLLALLPNALASSYSIIILFFLMIAMLFIAVLVLAMNFLAQVLYITPFPLLLTSALLTSTQPWSLQLASFSFVFWLFMLWLGHQQHQRLVENITLNLTNVDLLQQYKHSLKQAEAANLAKSEFLANMSHEIRTPMNSIIGRTRLALAHNIDEKTRSHLDMISSSSQNLLALINDILDFSKIEAGELTIEQKPFDLHELIKSCVNTITVLTEDKNQDLKLTCTISPEVPQAVRGDELRLRQIIFNLLSNAIKFTEKGRIDLVVDSLSHETNAETFQIKVQDTGIGIPPDKQEHIFQKFAQEDSSTTRNYGGTGLGLAICYELCQLMGGDIKVTSRPNEGSTFTVRLTLLPCNISDLPVKKKARPGQSSHISPLSLLIVEDNEANRILLRMVLEQDHHQIQEAHDGLMALNLLLQHDFDAILMDIQMPIMDGLTTSEIIRTAESGERAKGVDANLASQLKNRLIGSHTPIIAMTANAMAGNKEKCLAVGINHYLTKPFIPEDIKSLLSQINA